MPRNYCWECGKWADCLIFFLCVDCYNAWMDAYPPIDRKTDNGLGVCAPTE